MTFIPHAQVPGWFFKTTSQAFKGVSASVFIAAFEIDTAISAETGISSFPRNIRICVTLCTDDKVAIRAIISGNGGGGGDSR